MWVQIIQYFNKAMLTKQVWRLYSTPDLARCLRARYNPSKDVLQDKVRNQSNNYGESSLSIKVLVGRWELIFERF